MRKSQTTPGVARKKSRPGRTPAAQRKAAPKSKKKLNIESLNCDKTPRIPIKPYGRPEKKTKLAVRKRLRKNFKVIFLFVG